MGRYVNHYTDAEIKAIYEQWLLDKKQVDEKMAGFYHWDKDREYEKYFNNERIKKLFRHASFLYKAIFETVDLKLFPNEKQRIIEVYRRVLTSGYYSQSKIREKEVCAHLGKIISRQYRPKNK